MKQALVVTTIFEPTDAISELNANHGGWPLIVVGDRKTPADWSAHGAEFLPIAEHNQIAPNLAEVLPTDHYSRKNIGYLAAMQSGVEIIAETDDDNHPLPCFLSNVQRYVQASAIEDNGWQNIYAYFTGERIWPRGFPLDAVAKSIDSRPGLSPPTTYDCPVQQYLADGDPDVDAIYRLINSGEIRFADGSVALLPGTYCPFNSQNTVWWSDVFPLLYLPSFVSLRLTDIWRSFVAQACLHAAGVQVAFHGPTVYHRRHQHPLMKDFNEEIPGYLHNRRIMEILGALPLSSSPAKQMKNLLLCYEALVDERLLPVGELEVLDAWSQDVQRAQGA